MKGSTNDEVQSTAAAGLFGSGIGASISHTCAAPLSSGEGPGVRLGALSDSELVEPWLVSLSNHPRLRSIN